MGSRTGTETEYVKTKIIVTRLKIAKDRCKNAKVPHGNAKIHSLMIFGQIKWVALQHGIATRYFYLFFFTRPSPMAFLAFLSILPDLKEALSAP